MLALVSAAGLGVLMWAGAPGDVQTEDGSLDPTATGLRGSIPRRPVDSASSTFEGRENDDWNAVRPDERIDMAERAVAAALVDAADLEGAWMILSAARVDFFAGDAGAQRYVELERALSTSGPTTPDH